MLKAPLLAVAAGAMTIGSFAPLTAPAQAQAQGQDAGRFVTDLSGRAFGALKGDRARARAQFRALLSQNFAVEAIGDRLIRNWRPRISPAQYRAYKAAVPGFIIGTYADRLYEYADADLKVVRVQNQGNAAVVLTQVTRPGGRPVAVVWSLARAGGGYKVTNLTVGGVNLAMSQAADFNSYAQRNGFDALVKFMQQRG